METLAFCLKKMNKGSIICQENTNSYKYKTTFNQKNKIKKNGLCLDI